MTYDLYDTEMMNNWTIMIYNKTYYLLHVGMLTQNEFWLKTSFDSKRVLTLDDLYLFSSSTLFYFPRQPTPTNQILYKSL